MIFNRFKRACNKYGFTFVLSTYGSVSLVLRPNNTFTNFHLSNENNNLNQLLLAGIEKMRVYRKFHV